MANPTPDFVQVQLTAAGQKLAGAHPLVVSNGRRSLAFSGAVPVKVERSYEWNAWLSKKYSPTGVALFQIEAAPEAAPAAAASAAAATERPTAATERPTAAPAATVEPTASMKPSTPVVEPNKATT